MKEKKLGLKEGHSTWAKLSPEERRPYVDRAAAIDAASGLLNAKDKVDDDDDDEAPEAPAAGGEPAGDEEEAGGGGEQAEEAPEDADGPEEGDADPTAEVPAAEGAGPEGQ